MNRKLLLALGSLQAVTGAFMFLLPQKFYELTPGVADTGPLNMHFLLDAGLAYICSGCLILFGAAKRLRQVAVAGAIWPCLHALLHLQMWIARGIPFDLVGLVNLSSIQLPAWLTLAAALRLTRAGDQPISDTPVD